jgi:Family of unknown function (DUF6334)
MSNYENIGLLCDKTEKLLEVRYSVFDSDSGGTDWIEAVEIRFENIVATIYVESDFDTLRVELDEVKVSSDCHIKVVTSEKPWNVLIGRKVAWIWLLTNQQGYEDGLRLEFTSTQKKKELKIVTLIGIASSIQLFLSQEIKFSNAI